MNLSARHLEMLISNQWGSVCTRGFDLGDIDVEEAPYTTCTAMKYVCMYVCMYSGTTPDVRTLSLERPHYYVPKYLS